MMFNIDIESTAEIMGSLSSASKSRRTSDLFSSNIEIQVRRHQTFRPRAKNHDYPLVVSVDPLGTDEFFADLATYHSNQLPISAYCHIITEEIRDYFDPTTPEITPDVELTNRFRLACMGLALGEVVISSFGASDDLAVLSYAACRRSLGYIVARNNALHKGTNPKTIINRWIRLRELTGLPVTKQAIEVLTALQGATSRESDRETSDLLHSSLKTVLNEFIDARTDGQSIEESLTGIYPSLVRILPEFDGKFDDRMSVFLTSIELIQSESRGRLNDSFAVGYLCNKLLPGSFDHNRVLIRLFDFFPAALIWYGIFCTTSKQFDIRSFGNGLILKLLRDVHMPFFYTQRPQCDISLDELEILSRTRLKSDLIKPIQQRIASIALAPGVDILSRFRTESESPFKAPPTQNTRTISSAEISRTRLLLEEALILISRIDSHDISQLESQATKKRTRKSSSSEK